MGEAKAWRGFAEVVVRFNPEETLAGEITSQVRRDSVSPTRCLAALPSWAVRPRSRMRTGLASWLRSCRSRISFLSRHKRKRPCLSQIWLTIRPAGRPTKAAKGKHRKTWFDFSQHSFRYRYFRIATMTQEGTYSNSHLPRTGHSHCALLGMLHLAAISWIQRGRQRNLTHGLRSFPSECLKTASKPRR